MNVKWSFKMVRPGTTEPDWISVDGELGEDVYAEVAKLLVFLGEQGWHSIGVLEPQSRQAAPARRPAKSSAPTREDAAPNVQVGEAWRLAFDFTRDSHLLRVGAIGLLTSGSRAEYPFATFVGDFEAVRALVSPAVPDAAWELLPATVDRPFKVTYTESKRQNSKGNAYQDIQSIEAL